MKITAIVIAIILAGGATTAAVATVGNVDWDGWHLFGNHHEDFKVNDYGAKYSVIHTDPELKEQDGMYYSVVKLETHYLDGSMVLMNNYNRNVIVEPDEHGVYVTMNEWRDKDGNLLECKAYIAGTYVQDMVIKTYADMNYGTEYYNELCEKYNVSNVHFSLHHLKLSLFSKDTVGLFARPLQGGQEERLDDDFDYRMDTYSANVVFLSSNSILEIQLIDPTLEDSLKSIDAAEHLFNALMNQNLIRMTEITDPVTS